MERIDRRGERVLVLFPRRGRDQKEEVDKLQAAGVTRAWVQPQVPFMVPLLGGFLLAFFVGNVLLGFLVAVMPRP
jgi:prepilin signal peptidase PulO-like enzyme (type II secretory pathway)